MIVTHRDEVRDDGAHRNGVLRITIACTGVAAAHFSLCLHVNRRHLGDAYRYPTEGPPPMNDTRQHGPTVLVTVGAVLALFASGAIALFAFVGWGLTTGRLADTKVLSGNKIPPRIATSVTVAAGLLPGEQISHFYSASMTPQGDGNVLTNKRVISYVNDGSNAWCTSVDLGDIASVRLLASDSWLEDSTIVVTSSDDSELILYASTEDGGDLRFADAIRVAAVDDGG
ncbi:hypothetical protein LF1_55150 [Rubripirellula obstinata]|uniref:Uncharacterized protein n=2 Tax=Rubripirellula obstinata TaxID=406547 RepID=A0A5B1CAV5_9BACT|nr:hypothetical protein LF1_55150 [Rubripirellula obstinata]